MIYCKRYIMNATFTNALDMFSTLDLENWSEIEASLKARKKALQIEAREIKAKEKALEKENERELKKASKTEKKKLTAEEKDKANDYEKSRESLQAIIMRGVRKQAGTNKPKAPSFNNYSSWTSVLRDKIMLAPVLRHKKNLILAVDAGNGRKLNGLS